MKTPLTIGEINPELDDKELSRQLDRCQRLGIDDNLRLLIFLEGLENQIALLTEKLNKNIAE